MLQWLNNLRFHLAYFRLIVNKKDNRLKKGGGFHLDLFLLGVLAAFNGLFGLPWVWSATVRSVTHLGALTVFSTTHAPGEGYSTIRPNTFRPITFRPMSFCPKTICPTIFSPHDFCPHTILSCMIYIQKYFVHNVLGHEYLVQNRFSPKAFCLNTFSPCPLLSTQF